MGVKECSRPDCDRIMCHRHVPGRGYLCDDCWEELLQAKSDWPDPVTFAQVCKLVDEFFESPKGTFVEAAPLDEVFDRLLRGET
jgi:hypothetical protein